MSTSGNSQIWERIILLVLLVFFLISIPSKAQISTYVFDPNQSSIVQTGGIAYVHWTYSLKGKFELTIDPNAGTASFLHVDANAIDDSPYRRTLDPNEVFNMTSLAGIVFDNETILFIGKANDSSDIFILAIIQNDLIHLVGKTIPPPNSADFFVFSIDADAKRKYSGGTGEPNNPYKIATAEDLIALGNEPNDYDKHFIMIDDIDLAGYIFDRAVIAPDVNDVADQWGIHFFGGTPFSGIFDGNGHTISNLTIYGDSYLGLLGQLGSEAIISNLGMEAVDVNGTYLYIGGLVGESNGSITNCFSTGTVSGYVDVGGLVGGNSGSITTSYSTGSVSGSGWNVGGLAGYNAGSIMSSYSTASVSGWSPIDAWGGEVGGLGGLAGTNGGSITSSYSTGAVSGLGSYVGGLAGDNLVGSITLSFWDIETSGQSTSAGGTGKTTAEMKTESTFTDAGWDFVGETANGEEDIWSICEGTNYPRLVWQIPAGDFLCPDGIAKEDFGFFMDHWEFSNCDQSNGYCDGTDLDFSGTVDIYDLAILIDYWLKENP